ncbi:RNA-binding protein 44 isoform X2 [Rhineura floridana]|nr:RNA-binding protein 44 isoform X2 [Rhineura floridana]
MSCLPYFNEKTYIQPLLCASPWFLRDCPLYGHVISVVPFYFHPRVHVATPEIYNPVTIDTSNLFVVAPSFSPVILNHGQWGNSYYRYTTAEMNARGVQVLEKPNTIHSFSGERAVKCRQLSTSSEKNRFSEAVLKLSTDHSDASIVELRESNIENDAYKSTVLSAPLESEQSAKNEINNISGSCLKFTNCSTLSQSCYVSASELNLSKGNLPYFCSTFDEKLESAHKQGKKMSIALQDASETNANLDTDADFSYFRDNQNDYKCSDLDDDSQLEYHSAEEQDYVGQTSSYWQKTKSSETFQNKELSNEDGLADRQLPFNESKDESSTSVCNITCDCFKYSEIPEFPQKYEGSKCGTHGHCLNFDDKGRDETISTFCSIVNEESVSAKTNKERNNPKLFSVSIDENTKTDSLKYVSLKTGNRHVQQERTFLPHAYMPSGDPEVSDSWIYQQSVVADADKANCTYNSYSHHKRCEENFANLELNCITYLNNVASKNQSTVNQAVDASSDFRACFTTSRATNVKASVVSRAQNTVITMMNKERPKQWLTNSFKSVACNTDWSCISDSVEMTNSQIPMSDMLENCVTSDKAKHGCKSKIEDLLEWKNSISRDLNEIPNRIMQLSQEITNHLPNCCKEILQRAIKAEMQLLRLRYQLYQQHCWQTCNPPMEEKEYVNNSTLQTGKSLPQVPVSQNMEASSLPLVTHQENADENSVPDQSLSKKNSEKKKYELVENSSSDTQEISEGWFDATENLTVTDSSHSLTDQLKLSGTTETHTIKDTKKNYRVYIASLGPLVSEVDLWLHFQKYNVSEISICEYSANCRYAFLSFKTASDAKLAVKEMNEREIKGKAIKIQLVKAADENTVPDYQSYVKQHENQRPHYNNENNIEYRKNGDVMFKAPASASATRKVSSGVPFCSKGPNLSKGSSKSSFPVLALASVPRPVLDSSKMSLCAPAPCKLPNPDVKSSKLSPKDTDIEIDQEDIADGLLPLGSVQFTPNPSTTFIPPNTLNLRSFRKVVKKLEELHPEVHRDNILDALVEIKENKGLLSGLPLSTIVQMTSSLLKKRFGCKFEEKQNNLRNKP